MTLLLPPPGEVIAPVPQLDALDFWGHCRAGELVFKSCLDCGAASHPGAFVCRACCGRRLDGTVSSGLGRVYSYTVVWRPASAAFAVPYAPAIVDMEEGWSFMSCVIDSDHDEIEVGLEVRVSFRTLATGLVLPYFVSAGTSRPHDAIRPHK